MPAAGAGTSALGFGPSATPRGQPRPCMDLPQGAAGHGQHQAIRTAPTHGWEEGRAAPQHLLALRVPSLPGDLPGWGPRNVTRVAGEPCNVTRVAGRAKLRVLWGSVRCR